jgi:hypothetical protein
MERRAGAWYNLASGDARDRFPPGRSIDRLPRVLPRIPPFFLSPFLEFALMAKPHRNLKKANHGARPANSKARKAKRKHIRT